MLPAKIALVLKTEKQIEPFFELERNQMIFFVVSSSWIKEANFYFEARMTLLVKFQKLVYLSTGISQIKKR